MRERCSSVLGSSLPHRGGLKVQKLLSWVAHVSTAEDGYHSSLSQASLTSVRYGWALQG